MTPLQRVGRGILAGAVLALAVAAPQAKGKKNEGPYTIVPAVGAQTEVGAGIESVTVHREGLTAEIAYVTGVPRRRMMEATLGIQFDPFASPPGQPQKLHTFVVSLENSSSRRLTLNPSTCRMRTDTDQVSYGADYTLLYQMFGSGKALTMEQVQKVAYDRPLALDPGGKARKLLVFEDLPGGWQNLLVALPLETDGLGTFDLTAPFRKLYLEAKP